MIITYKDKPYKCEITYRDNNAMRVRVYDEKNVGNLYIWTKGYDMPKPWHTNTSKLIPLNAVLVAFKELLRVANNNTKQEITSRPRVTSDAALTKLPDETKEASSNDKPEIKTRQRKAKADRFS